MKLPKVNTAGAWGPVSMEPHYCFPPPAYPQGLGPGSIWKCERASCGRSWVSEGVQVVSDKYPMGVNREDRLLGPERWYHYGGRTPAPGESAMYDFRNPVIPVLQKLEDILEALWKERP